MSGPRRTEPTRSLLQGGAYTNAASTDIRARFAAMKQAAEMAAEIATPAPNVRRLSRTEQPRATRTGGKTE